MATIEYDDPFKLWKGASAFAHKNAVITLKSQWLGPPGRRDAATAFIVRPPRPSKLATKLHDKLRGPPFVYTHFRWMEDGEWKYINRTDVCTAYLRLCDEYNELGEALQGLERLVKDSDTLTVERELAFRARYRTELDVIRARGQRLLPRLKFAVGNMAQYLEFLNWCENNNKHPPKTAGIWARYPGPVTADSVRLPEEERERTLFRNGNMEDYPFRAARVINKTEAPEGVRMLRKKIERVAREMLQFKGCKDVDERVWRYIPKKKGLPPPNVVISTTPIADIEGVLKAMSKAIATVADFKTVVEDTEINAAEGMAQEKQAPPANVP